MVLKIEGGSSSMTAVELSIRVGQGGYRLGLVACIDSIACLYIRVI